MSEHDHLIAMLNRLKLTALRDQLDSLIDEAGRRELTIRESLALFCEREIARRDQRRIDMGFGLARFPFVRELAGFDFAAQPSLDKAQIREIASGRFIANGEAEPPPDWWTPLLSSRWERRGGHDNDTALFHR
jgi:DNA replication protein DnaC